MPITVAMLPLSICFSINIIKVNNFKLKVKPSFKFSNNSKLLDFVNAYGDKFLSSFFPNVAEVAE